MEMENESSILQQAINGDVNAFAHIAENYYDMIFRIAYKWSGVKSDAEDIAQEVCMKLAKSIKSFNQQSKFSTWLYKITINTAKDFHKKHSRHYANELHEEHISNEQNAEEKVINNDLWKHVKLLPAKQSDAILLVYAEGLTHSEAADIMECKESTVSWYIHEAKKALHALLGGEL